MEDDVKFLRIKPFDGTGFNNWCFRMKAYMQQLEVLHCVERAAEEEDFWNVPENETAEEKAVNEIKRAARVRQDNKCRSILIQSIADSHLEYVKDKVSPKQIWEGLHNVFERKSITNRFLLKRQLLSMRFDESDRLQDHFLRFDQLVREIKGAGAKMEEEDIICHLMLTMPSSYDAVTTAMEAVSDNLTMDLVRKKYLDVEAKRRGQKMEVEAEDTAFAGKSRPKFKCFSCGEMGHKKAQCPKSSASGAGKQPSKKQVQKANVSKSVAFIAADVSVAASGAVVGEKWFLDSGASEHMCNEKNVFEKLEELEKPVIIQTAKTGVNLFANKKGRVTALSVVGAEQITITMDDVLYIPELSFNLLSLRRLENTGKKVIFFGGCVTVECDGEVVATGKQHGQLYSMDFECKQKGGSRAMVGKVSRKLELWHHRFGHLGEENLRKLVKNDMVKGMNIDSDERGSAKFLCESCVTAKQTRGPFQSRTEKRASRPLEIVHSDVCGPITPQSWDGYQYFVSFTDDYTHVAVVYLMRSKDEVLDRLKEYEAMASAHFRAKISRLRCDNGGEYTGRAVRSFCRQKGIRLETTVAYTPEQNGVSERLNRTVVEKVRAMLAASGVDKKFWGEALYTAVYVLNRSPSVAVQGDITPFEAWYGKKPDVSNLRVFGSQCFAHKPKQLRKKLDNKSEKVVFVGYAPGGYRVWNGKRVFVARDVVFNEVESPSCVVPVRESKNDLNFENENIVIIEQKDEPKTEREICGQECEPEDNPSEYESVGDSEAEDASASGEEEGAVGGVPCDTMSNSGVRKSGRVVAPPAWQKDYDMDVSVFALCAEEYIDNIPSNVSELKNRSDWPSWEEAIQEELSSLEKNKTWTLVELPAGKKLIDSKWVFKMKKNSEGVVERYKARLVARGFTQRPGFDFAETYSPVLKMSTLRILLALANHENWSVHQMDVRSAFLNGGLQEEIFMRQPAGFEKGKHLVCKLNKAIYGLKQASRNWNQRFHDFIVKLGYKRSEHDFCLYYRSAKGVVTYIVIYVDDILLVSNSDQAIADMKRKLSAEFEMKDLNEIRSFLGLNVQRNRQKRIMTIDQRAYVQGILERFGMQNCKASAIPMDPNLRLEKEQDPKKFTDKPYRELVGCLMYLMVTSRPDICAAVNYFAGFQCGASEQHWVHLKRILRYLRGTDDFKLVYGRDKPAETLEAFTDADWGNDPNDRRSVSGFVIKLHGSTVSWATRKQSSVALSSTEAELMALCQGSCELMWVMNLLDSIGVVVKKPVTVHEDNQSCISVTVEPRKHKRMKHIEIQHFFVRELIERGRVQLKYLQTDDQVADLMTKGLSQTRFRKLRDLLGVSN